jgi:hypothetical protein
MREEIKNAVDVANAYRNDHEGEIPVLVIAHTEGGMQDVYVGVFRNHKNHIAEDQKMFCSVMRLAFAMNKVYRYEVIVKPEFNYSVENMTLNALAVMAISETDKAVQWFEITDDDLEPHFSDDPMPVEGLFTQLLPTPVERDYEYNAKMRGGVQAYLDACTYTVPVKIQALAEGEEVSEQDAALAEMMAAFS